MCGIVGYVGRRGAADIILSGLKRLEYRGYDSAGIALHGVPLARARGHCRTALRLSRCQPAGMPD